MKRSVIDEANKTIIIHELKPGTLSGERLGRAQLSGYVKEIEAMVRSNTPLFGHDVSGYRVGSVLDTYVLPPSTDPR